MTNSAHSLGFTGFSTLNGDNNADSFVIGAAGSIANINGGTGADSLNLVALAAATVTLNSDSASGYTGTSSVGVTNFSNIDSITSAAGGTLTSGLAGSTTWTVTGASIGTVLNGGNTLNFTGFSTLDGDNNADSFVIGAAGSIANINGGSGADSLNLSALTAATVQLNTDSASGYAGTSSVGVTNFSNIDSITSAAGGTLKSNLGTAASWTISGGSSGTVANGGNNLTFAGFSILDANNHGDSFTFGAAGSVATINGGTGSDSIDLSALAAATVHLTASSVSGFNGTSSVGITGSFTKIDSITSAAGGTRQNSIGSAATWNVGASDTLVNSGHTLTFAGFGTLTGGGTDTLDATDAVANAWTISGANSGSVSGGVAYTFTGMNTLDAGSAGDSFTFNAGGSVTNINGGAGVDSIDVSALAAATVQLNSDTASGYAGTSTVGVTNFSNIDSITSAAGGTLKSNLGTAAAWTISGGSSGTVANGGNNLTFAGFSILDADNHGDSFTFGAAGSIATINGGTGSDSINLAALTAATVQLNTDGANGYNGTSSVGITGSFTNIDSITSAAGGTLTSALTGSTTWTVSGASSGTVLNSTRSLTFAGFSTLNGDNNADSFVIGAAGSIANINGGTGADSLNLSALAAATVTLNSDSASGYAGTSSVGVSNFTNIDSITSAAGGTLTSALTGSTTWTVTGSSIGTVTNSAHSLGFTGFSTLNGDNNADSFVIGAAGSIANINGGTGADSLNLVALAAATVTLNSDSASGYTGTSSVGVTNFSNIDSITSAAGGTLTSGLAGSTTWTVTGASIGTVLNGGNTLNFTGFSTLNGDNNADSFVIGAAGSIANINGGSGADSLNLSALTAATAQLNTDSASGYAGTSSVGVTNFSNIDSITSAAGGTLKSNLGTAASWTISGGSSGTVANGGNNLTFAGFSILDADNHGDSFTFGAAGSVATINGGTGSDSIDLSALAAATVHLTASSVSGFNGTSSVGITGSFTNIDSITSAAGGTLQNSIGSAATWNVGASDTLVNSGHTLTFAGFGTLTGGGTDTLDATDAVANAWTISGANSGSVSGGVAYTFTGMNTLDAGSAGDSFTFNAGGSVTNINGGAGVDSIDVSALAAATVQLNSDTASGYAGTSTVGVTNFSNIDSITSAAGGTLKSNLGTAASWTISGGSSGTVANGGNNLTFAGFSILDADNHGDSFTFGAAGSVATINGGTGSDSINLAALTAATVQLNTDGANGYNGTSSVGITGSFTNIDSITSAAGGTLTSALTGSTTWTVSGASSGTVLNSTRSLTFAGFSTLNGDNNADSFVIGAAGSIANINGGTGADSLNLSALAAGTVDLTASTANGYAGTSTVGVSNFTKIDSITGSVGSTLQNGIGTSATWTVGTTDTLVDSGHTLTFAGFTILAGSGSDNLRANDAVANNWSLSGANSGSITGGVAYSFSGMANLTGGTGSDTFTIAGGTVSGTVSGGGGAGSDTIVGDASGDYFAITGSNAGSVGTSAGTPTNLIANFTGIANLTGGAGDDTFAFINAGSLTGNIDGGGHVAGNTVDYSASTTVSAVTLGAALPGAGSISNIQDLVGSGAGFTLIADGNGDTFDINAVDAGSVTYGVGGVNSLVFTNVGTLQGGAGVDTFAFVSVTAQMETINGSGNDKLDYSAYTGGAINVALSTISSGTASLITNNFTGINTLVGSGNAGDVLTGFGGAHTWNITGANAGNIDASFHFSAIANLMGGSGNDTFALAAGGSISGNVDGGGGLGSDTISGLGTGNYFAINGANSGTVGTASGTPANLIGTFSNIANLKGGAGTDDFVFANNATLSGSINGVSGSNDKVDYSAYTGGVSIILTGSTANGYSGTDGGISGGFSNIDILTAGNGSTLQGESTTSAWSITGTDSGTYNDGSGHDASALIWNTFANLTGGTGNDTFTIAGGTISGTVSGGGGAGSDTIVGNAAGDYFAITGANAGSVGTSAGTPANLIANFTGIANLTGGAGDDTFAFQNAGSLTGNIDGGGHAAGNVVDYSASTTVSAVTLGAALPGAGSISNIQDLVGSGVNFTLIADGNGDIFDINGVDAGNVSYGVGGVNSLVFTGVGILQGGAGVDTFAFVTNTAQMETITGSGNDKLDYSGYSGGAISVTLSSISAGTASLITNSFTGIDALVGTGNAGDLLTGFGGAHTWNITGANTGNIDGTFSFSNVANLTGGAGADTFKLAGGTISGTITGGGGVDTLKGNVTGEYFDITGSDSGTLGTGVGSRTNLVGNFTGIQDLTDTGGGATFAFDGGSVDAITGNAGSTDTLDYSQATGPISVTLTTISTGTGSDMTTGFSGIDALIGTNAGDTLTGFGGTHNWNITGSDTGNIDGTFSFSNVANLTGGSGADTFKLAGGTISGTITGGGGVDTLKGNVAGEYFDITGSDSGTLGTGAGSRTNLVANFTGIQDLTDTGGGASFAFDGGSVDTITGNAGSTDTLDYSHAAGPISVTLTTINTGTGSDMTTGFSGIDALVGTGAGDTLTGFGGAHTWNITGTDTGNVDGSFSFTNVANLTGGSGNDTFALGASGTLSGTITGGSGTNALTAAIGGEYFNISGVNAGSLGTSSGSNNDLIGNFTGIQNLTDTGAGGSSFAFNGGTIAKITGAGNDILDYSGTGGPISVILSTSTSGTGSDITGTGFTGINQLIGTGSGDTLTGTNGGDTWNLNAADGGKIDGVFTYSNIANITGGTGSDTFTLTGGSVSGTLTGGGGTDTLVGDNGGDFFAITGTDIGTVGTTAGGTDLVNAASLASRTSPAARGAIPSPSPVRVQ